VIALKPFASAMLALALAGCGLWNFPGIDTSTVVIRTQQIGCCYTEGALHFARFEGPTNGEESLDGGADRGNTLRDPIPLGLKSFELAPGHYVMSVWARPCDGNCGNLDPPTDGATAEFDVLSGRDLSILVEFVLLKETRITIGEPGSTE
jgi:hypothetical protein